MKQNNFIVGCACCPMNRRNFLTRSAAATAGALGALAAPSWLEAAQPTAKTCRTKLCAEPVGDIEKLFRMWDQWGWHRVAFYGDLRQPVYALADALGWKVMEEA